jgi:hypothetical protein
MFASEHELPRSEKTAGVFELFVEAKIRKDVS